MKLIEGLCINTMRGALILGFLILPVKACGQIDCPDSAQYDPLKVNNIVGFIPSKARVTNGLALNWLFNLEMYCDTRDSIRINGLYSSVGPAQALFVAFIPAFIPHAPSFKGLFDADSRYLQPVLKHQVNGVTAGILEIGENFSFQGLSVVLTYQNSGALNGLSVSGLASRHEHFNGVLIAGIKTNTQRGRGLQLSMINTATRMSGIQIGLVNNAYGMRGVQIGLWNKIGKRGFPFINFRFK